MFKCHLEDVFRRKPL